MIANYSEVVLVTDKYASEGARSGMIGYVIETYEDGRYEVEFSDSTTGVTLALLSVTEEDLRLSAEPGTATGHADGSLLQGLIRAELGRLRLDHWGYFFPAHLAVWRFIREQRPSALDEVKCGYDTQPWFSGRGAHWFMETLVNRDDFVDLVEAIMYAAADHLRRSGASCWQRKLQR